MEDPRKRAVEFGARLRTVREGNNDSLRDVQRRSGLNSGYLSQLENGKITYPSPSILEKVASGYGVRFEDLLMWAGYVTAPQAPTPNQAVAFNMVSSLGDPSDEELDTLKAIVGLLKSKRSATYHPPSDLPLDQATRAEIRRHALALLKEADGLGVRPTPLDDIQAAGRLVLAGAITLDAKDRERLFQRFGHWVDRAWRRLQGTFDFRSSEIWVAPDLHAMKRRFVISHEIGHAILPAHRQTFAYIDDLTNLPPLARDLFEREANEAAVEILFQCGQGADEFDSSTPSLQHICRISERFGASIVATARYVAETSRRPVAVAVAHHNDTSGMGPTHLYMSPRFRADFGWTMAGGGPAQIRGALRCAGSQQRQSWIAPNRAGEPRVINVSKLDTGYAAIALLVAESRTRAVTRRIASLRRGAP